MLAATRHGDEIEALRVEAVALAQAAVICGDPNAVACYLPDAPDTSSEGQMWFAVDDTDVIHTIVHEYGHHVDNQLLNLRYLDVGCSYSNDGSRNWFFERDIQDDILGAGISCSADNDWEHLLGELYAEDFVALNGIRDWTLSSVRSPTQNQLSAMAYDIAHPFATSKRTWHMHVSQGACHIGRSAFATGRCSRCG